MGLQKKNYLKYQYMISKWFEVSVDLFNIIFDTYWKNKKSWTYDKSLS